MHILCNISKVTYVLVMLIVKSGKYEVVIAPAEVIECKGTYHPTPGGFSYWLFHQVKNNCGNLTFYTCFTLSFRAVEEQYLIP